MPIRQALISQPSLDQSDMAQLGLTGGRGNERERWDVPPPERAGSSQPQDTGANGKLAMRSWAE